MNRIYIDHQVKEISELLIRDSKNKIIDYFPIDRFFIERNRYLEKILSLNYLELLLYNFEKTNPTYTVQLFVCLPELWEKVCYEDIKILVENFTNSFSFYSLIEFTYKYLEIDLFDEIIYNENIENNFKRDCLTFFINILDSLYLDEYDYLEFEENLFGINIEKLQALQFKFKENREFKKTKSKKELYEKLSTMLN
ncbi:hypothetical protein MKJ01_16365 [Chryseobacterium sp. SSA4.19]|uniref:hypothetical protein n=1 Tax=Chryseobacterium sp. SSA4.19 TaxID=2919915 RepID=UPI001F4E10A3|nr:hypothetical protein [Chryseobacterium sp. SSA4.19]MCJ8155341.1 hypothetical protein [Chryseobacterium sp. SSA4.19]